jgi:hypothetical protein
MRIHSAGGENTNHQWEDAMRVNFISLCGLLVVLGMLVALSAAQAGDHKDSVVSGSRFSDFVTNISPSPHRHGGASFLVTDSDSKSSRLHPEAATKEKESGPIPAKDRKKIILFRLDPKFGDVSVQPVFGPVNGAQVSVGF